MDKLTIAELNTKIQLVITDKRLPAEHIELIKELSRRLNLPGWLSWLFPTSKVSCPECKIEVDSVTECRECKGRSKADYLKDHQFKCAKCVKANQLTKCQTCERKISKKNAAANKGICGHCRIKTGKRTSIPKGLRIAVWDKQIGKHARIGECFLCKREIKFEDFEAGHKESVANGGKTDIDNLVPLCGICNKSHGAENIDVSKARFTSKD